MFAQTIQVGTFAYDMLFLSSSDLFFLHLKDVRIVPRFEGTRSLFLPLPVPSLEENKTRDKNGILWTTR